MSEMMDSYSLVISQRWARSWSILHCSLALAIAVVITKVIDTTSANITASISIVDRYMIAFRVVVGNPTSGGDIVIPTGTIVP